MSSSVRSLAAPPPLPENSPPSAWRSAVTITLPILMMESRPGREDRPDPDNARNLVPDVVGARRVHRRVDRLERLEIESGPASAYDDQGGQERAGADDRRVAQADDEAQTQVVRAGPIAKTALIFVVSVGEQALSPKANTSRRLALDRACSLAMPVVNVAEQL